MKRPRMIANDDVIKRVKSLLQDDALTRTEMAALIGRTRTIFGMSLLSYQEELFVAEAAAPAQFMAALPIIVATSRSLDFKPTPSPFEPRPVVVAPPSDGMMTEALGLKPKGFKPIEIAKAALSRMQALGAAWLIEGGDDYYKRGVSEMLAICRLPHWGRDHHLAVATIMQALAIGYDWLHARLDEADKVTIRQALIAKGFDPMLEAFNASPQPNWITVPSNWNVVCNASLIMAALAIDQDTNATSVARVKVLALKSLEAGLRLYDADGSWKLEGPGYWHLATEHLTYLLAALETTQDEGVVLFRQQAIANTCLYRCYMTSPSSALFNFGDSEEQRPGLWWARWFGGHFGKPEFHEIAEDRSGRMGAAPEVHPMDILWRRRQPPDDKSALAALPTAAVFAEAAVMRGEWGSPMAPYVGIKGGQTSGLRSHSHLDLGHFVYEAGGKRWAIDHEPDDYTDCYLEPPERYKYYRAGTIGHNTLLIDGVNQAYTPAGASAPAIAARFSPLNYLADGTQVAIDIGAAYPMASRVERTFTLAANGALIIVDEIAPRSGSGMTVQWNMHTRATVTCHGTQARLTQSYGSAREAIILYATLTGPPGAQFSCVEACAAVPHEACEQVEASNIGVKRLQIDLGRITEPARLTVKLSLLPD